MEIVHRALSAMALAAAGVAVVAAGGEAFGLLEPPPVALAETREKGPGLAREAPRRGEGPFAPRVVGHRGFGGRGGAPENSLAAVRSALEAGASGIEIDAVLAADGAVLVLHDPTLERTTTCRGCVSERTRASIEACRLRGGEGPTKERVPTLGEVFELVGALPGELLVLVDAKPDPGPCPHPRAPRDPKRRMSPSEHARALGLAVGALAEASGMAGRSFVYGGDVLLEAARKAAPSIGTLRLSESAAEGLEAASRHGFSGISMRLGEVREGDAERLHAEGLLLDVYVANAPEDFRRAARLGADFVETDDVEGALSVLRSAALGP